MDENIISFERPGWDDYFMSLAILAATRSHDAQTQYGAVIVKDKHILSMGYNGFPPGLNDEQIPNTRPLKYNYVLHAEENALANCTVRPVNATIYVSGIPCLGCLKQCIAHGIMEIVYLNHKSNMVSEYNKETKKAYDLIVAQSDIIIRPIGLFSLRAFDRAQDIINKL